MICIMVDYVNSGELPNFQEIFTTIYNKETSMNLSEEKDKSDQDFPMSINNKMSEIQKNELDHSPSDPNINYFNDFAKTHISSKQDYGNSQENLEYSESLEASGVRASNNNEFDINLLNSEYDQPPPKGIVEIQSAMSSCSSYKMLDNTPFKIPKIEKEPIAVHSSSKSGFNSAREVHSSTYQKSALCSPEDSSQFKDYKNLKHQLLEAENELNKKTALFEQEIKYWEQKAKESASQISQLKENLERQGEIHQSEIVSKANKFEREFNQLQSKYDHGQDKISSMENQLRTNKREIEKEQELRINNDNQYSMQVRYI